MRGSAPAQASGGTTFDTARGNPNPRQKKCFGCNRVTDHLRHDCPVYKAKLLQKAKKSQQKPSGKNPWIEFTLPNGKRAKVSTDTKEVVEI